jgi:hypothetical protein
MIQKGARSPRTLYPLKIFNRTQPGSTIGGRHVLAEPETLRRCLHFTPEFHKCYSSTSFKNDPLCQIPDRQNFAVVLDSAATISAPMLVIGFRGRADDLHLPTYVFRRVFNHQSLSFVQSRAEPMGTLLPGQLPIYNLFKPVPHMKSTKRFVDVTALIAPGLLQTRAAYPKVRFRVMVRE